MKVLIDLEKILKSSVKNNKINLIELKNDIDRYFICTYVTLKKILDLEEENEKLRKICCLILNIGPFGPNMKKLKKNLNKQA